MRRVSAVVMLALLLGPMVAAIVWNFDQRVAIGIATLTALAVVALLGVRLRAALTSDAAAREGDGWSLVPAWQYEGRHAESGGIARGEQERAIQDIEDQAERERDSD